MNFYILHSSDSIVLLVVKNKNIENNINRFYLVKHNAKMVPNSSINSRDNVFYGECLMVKGKKTHQTLINTCDNEVM